MSIKTHGINREFGAVKLAYINLATADSFDLLILETNFTEDFSFCLKVPQLAQFISSTLLCQNVVPIHVVCVKMRTNGILNIRKFGQPF